MAEETHHKKQGSQGAMAGLVSLQGGGGDAKVDGTRGAPW